MLRQLLAFTALVNTKCRSLEFLLMCAKLQAEPDLKLSALLLFLQTEAKISLSTANRLVTNASEAGYIILARTEEGHRPSLVRLSVLTGRRFEISFKNAL